MQAKQVFSTYSGQEDSDLGQFKVCPFCGTQLALKEKGGRQRPACPNCRFVQFRNPSPGAVVLIEKDGQVLLGRRFGSYGAKKWGLPQGFIEFDEDFVAITEDGARWLVARGVRLVGVDSLSVGPYADTVPTHQILLRAGVVVVEGLDLSGVGPGVYQLVCLPLKIVGADGAPARAILIDQGESEQPGGEMA